MRKIIVASLMMLTFTACDKKEEPETMATIKDYTGLDGCGLLIKLDNGTVLEPVSIPENITLIADRRVAIRYQNQGTPSICMVGPTVKVLSLRYL